MRFGWVAEFFTPNPAISIVTGVDYRMTREKYHIYVRGRRSLDRQDGHLSHCARPLQIHLVE